ncbi:MAG: hypothetical protein PHO32_10480, partial [Candidatus Cloacimonetes bacterium]|nr:hypothetical protein [Candidatus Cloacimonadota bacterium]
MKKALLNLSVVLLIVITLVSGCAKKAGITDQKAKISEFSVTDLPYDDGSGVVLKWKPLDKSHRVIQYNIYRGVSPDSLFFLNSVEVDPKAGVAAPEMFFYDSGEQPLIEFESSPSKLKREKQQAAGSPLFGRFPADVSLLSSMIGRFNVQGGIDSGKMYRRHKPITREEDVLAGVKLHNFDYIFGIPVPDQEYYYTVLAIDEQNRYLPYADIQKIVPVDNPPEDRAVVHSTYVTDTGVINFEWNPPVSSLDIAMWEGWLISKPQNVQEGVNPLIDNSWQANGIPLFQSPNYSNATTQYFRVDTKAEGINLPSNMEDYTAVLAYQDYAGLSSAALARHFRLISSEKLPVMPTISISDKQNDKGDNLVISVGKPIAYVVTASYTNSKRTALRVNYEIANNENYKIDKLQFTFLSADGEKIDVVTEHFVDKTVRLKLPGKYAGLKDLKIRIALETTGSNAFDADYTEQHVVYDDNNKLFKGEDVLYRGEPISTQYMDILVKNSFAPDFLPGNKTNGTTRSYDHGIPYESMVYQQIVGVDKASKR